MGVCNMETGFNTMGSLLSGLKIDFAEPEPEVSEVPEKETEPEELEGFAGHAFLGRSGENRIFEFF